MSASAVVDVIDGYIDDRSQIQVHTDERTPVHSARLPWWSPIQVLSEVNVP